CLFKTDTAGTPCALQAEPVDNNQLSTEMKRRTRASSLAILHGAHLSRSADEDNSSGVVATRTQRIANLIEGYGCAHMAVKTSGCDFEQQIRQLVPIWGYHRRDELGAQVLDRRGGAGDRGELASRAQDLGGDRQVAGDGYCAVDAATE